MDVRMETYRIFEAVCAAGSLTAAAASLYITQSAVSQAISGLEKTLGAPLFVRGARGVTLTQEGRMLHGYVSQALTLLDNAEKAFEHMQNLQAGMLRIGASDTLCMHFLLPMLERFHALNPLIQIQVTNRTTPVTLELLRSAQVDIAFINLPIEAHGVQIDPCMAVHDCFVASPRAFAKSAPLPLAELSQLPLMLLESGSHTRRLLDAFFEQRGLRLHPQIELCSYEVLVEFARIGLGVAGVVREFVQDEIRSGALFEVETEEALPPRNIGLARHSGLRLSPAAQRFVELLGER